jgi:hypothetical protein
MRKSVIIATLVVASAISGIVGSVLTGVAGTLDTPRAQNCDGCLVGVAANGAPLGSRGVDKVERIAEGGYKVTFKKTVAGCVILANVVDFFETPDPFFYAYITTQIVSAEPKSVRYFSYGVRHGFSTFVPIDQNFTSALICL